nr:spore protease YyaC [Paenibacillus sp. SYP-B4298]
MKSVRIRTNGDQERCRQRRLNELKSAPQPLRKRMDGELLLEFLTGIARCYPQRGRILFLCIGTDRSTGDAFGPLIGSMLRRQGWPHVIGTMEEPCDARMLEQIEDRLPQDKVVVAIDACLGKPGSVGMYLAAEGPLRPAQATGAIFPQLGNYSIAGVVNTIGPKPYMTLQTTSLHTVMNMAAETAELVRLAWGRQDHSM